MKLLVESISRKPKIFVNSCAGLMEARFGGLGFITGAKQIWGLPRIWCVAWGQGCAARR